MKAEISKFQQCTGFHCRQVNLSLQNAWPTRRDRAWWILSSPLVGPIDVEEMPVFSDLDNVRKVIPGFSLGQKRMRMLRRFLMLNWMDLGSHMTHTKGISLTCKANPRAHCTVGVLNCTRVLVDVGQLDWLAGDWSRKVYLDSCPSM